MSIEENWMGSGINLDGLWRDFEARMPGSPVIGQIRIPLPQEAIAQVRDANDDADGYQYELTLENVELVNETKPAT